ncbi:MAG TPA: DUF4395 domain-containing protein [Candidatus Corynebacterium avicola]|uniref:DUF4395 domain-containing protein n=1 Tax=Candidatus Corynebacterium avicola TaxID=2838527 RepID=A0A9D1RMJ2_9CORY|nr:DUF4395 domain-containing protein [Candidatus Corynebacterium avicola]
MELNNPVIPSITQREAQATPPSGIATLWWFPPVVNDKAARTTAMLVVALSAVTLVFSWVGASGVAIVLNLLLLVGFVLRVLGGPRFDPFGQLSVRVLAGKVFGDPVLTAGPPKRFAQGIGVVFSAVSLALRIAGGGEDGGLTVAADIVLLLLVVAASLEGFAGYCLGCRVFSQLQAWGIVRADVRSDCVVR